jgi:hypothetical protein
MRIALRAAARPFETAGVVDASLCNGAAVAHNTYRLFLATRFAQAARLWLARTLATRPERRGFGGFARTGGEA